MKLSDIAINELNSGFDNKLSNFIINVVNSMISGYPSYESLPELVKSHLPKELANDYLVEEKMLSRKPISIDLFMKSNGVNPKSYENALPL